MDSDNPSELLARSKYNILEPREIYELVGQVPNVVFPSGLIVNGEKPINRNTELFVYYGAADTSVCLATATIGEIMDDLEYY